MHATTEHPEQLTPTDAPILLAGLIARAEQGTGC